MTQSPVYVYVFDLDNTLMDTNRLFAEQRGSVITDQNIEREYDRLVPTDPYLIHLLRHVRGQKYILSNGTRAHVYQSCRALGIRPLLAGQVDRNTGPHMKPHPSIYNVTHNYITGAVPDRTSIIFFDDLVENLVYPKTLGWTTVLINPRFTQQSLDHVDVVFPDIYTALNECIKHLK